MISPKSPLEKIDSFLKSLVPFSAAQFDSIFRGELLDQVIGINQRSLFSFAEAQALLPVVFRITKTYSTKVESIADRLQSLSGQNEELVRSLETQINQLIQDWQGKVTKLGALPKGLWIADFDSGDGYFCWKFPERDIAFWHKYDDGYSKRVPVGERESVTSLLARTQTLVHPSRPLGYLPHPEFSE